MRDTEPALEFDERKIDGLFAELNQCRMPGAAVGLAIRGTPVYRKGFGLASAELPVVLSPGARMRIGSTTKHLTALAYMLLCEAGKASPDDSVAKYLPELHPVTHAVTMRQLMGHVSGLRDASDICWLFNGTAPNVSSEELLAFYKTLSSANTPPGTDWSYNNGGYLILTAAIERIADRSLEDVLQGMIFAPAGMYDTMLRRSDDDLVPNSAALHLGNVSQGFHKARMGTAFSGEGGVVSTVDDMLRWLAQMRRRGVGSEATWAAMTTPQTLAGGGMTEYGLGLVTSNYRGLPTLSHAGGVMGGNSQMLTVPSVGLDIVVMLNRGDVTGMDLVARILDACFPSLAHSGQNTCGTRLASGCYRSERTGRVIELSLADSEAPKVAIDGFEVPYLIAEDGVLRPVEVWSWLRQSIRAANDSIVFSSCGIEDGLVAVEQADPHGAHSVQGQYRSEEIETTATISEGGAAGLELKTTGLFGSSSFRLQNLGKHLWKASAVSGAPWGGILSFSDDHRAFAYSSSRTRGLCFRRVATVRGVA